MGFKLKGVNEMVKKLESKGRNVERVKGEALRAGGEVIRTAMAKRAPRSTLNKKHMADNIIVSEVKSKTNKVEIGPVRDFFYAYFLEFGTRKMAARPFAFPAFEESKNGALKAIADVIRKEIER